MLVPKKKGRFFFLVIRKKKEPSLFFPLCPEPPRGRCHLTVAGAYKIRTFYQA